MVDLDNLRNNFRKRRARELKERMANENSDSGFKKTSAGLSEVSDISFVVLKGETLYFSFSETGQRFKIPLSKIGLTKQVDNLQEIFDKIEELELPVNHKNREALTNLEYCNNNLSFLANVDLCVLAFNDVKSFTGCLNLIRKKISKKVIMCHEPQLATMGFVGMQSDLKEEQLIKYNYRNTIINIESGDGVIEFKTIEPSTWFERPNIKDFIRGSVIQIGRIKGWIKDILALFITPHSLSLIVNENGRVRNVIPSICSETTIPSRKSVEIELESTQTLSIEMDGNIICSDINKCFDKVDCVEIDANFRYFIKGFKDNKNIEVPLYELIS